MTESPTVSQPPAQPQAPPKRSLPAGAWRFLRRHPLGVLQGAFLLLVLVIVLQNLEPTQLDVLFWSIANVPKLVLIFGAMLVGGVLWEILRRLLIRQR
jgi:uncharacterized integral membrane protein